MSLKVIVVVLTTVSVFTFFYMANNQFFMSGDTQVNIEEKLCSMEEPLRSSCIIKTILDDVDGYYDARGGGGVSSVTQVATNVYEVTILQEGRKDVLTYEVEVSPKGRVEIASRTERTISYD